MNTLCSRVHSLFTGPRVCSRGRGFGGRRRLVVNRHRPNSRAAARHCPHVPHLAPSAPSSSTTALPMPWVPPVTSTLRPTWERECERVRRFGREGGRCACPPLLTHSAHPLAAASAWGRRQRTGAYALRRSKSGEAITRMRLAACDAGWPPSRWCACGDFRGVLRDWWRGAKGERVTRPAKSLFSLTRALAAAQLHTTAKHERHQPSLARGGQGGQRRTR